MTMSGNSLRFVVVDGGIDGGEIVTPSAKVYFNGELVAEVLTGLTAYHDRNPAFDASKPCPLLSVKSHFHSVIVEKGWR